MKKLAIIVLTVATTFTGIAPAQAFPTIARPDVPQASNVEQVQYYRRHWNRYRYDDDRWRHRDYDDGWRYRRYHRHNNAGAIIGGLAAGAIIGGIISAQRQPRYYYAGGSYHTRWCYSRYRSYRAYDNTYQPYYGPRRQCVSP
jgi:hypothetical protein